MKHEWTSWACMDALFNFFETKYNSLQKEPNTKNLKVDL